MEKRKFSYTIGGKVKWYKHYGEQYGGTLKKLNVELLYDPASPLLGMYLEKTIIQKNACTPLFTAALLTISKTWKKPKCPSTEREEWIKVQYMYRYTHTYTHTHTYIHKHGGILLSHKKTEIMLSAATWTDVQTVLLTKVSQTKRDKYHMIPLIFRI